MPEIAVIIPAYVRNEHEKQWLIDAVSSVLLQTFRDYEVIVVNDASPYAINNSVWFPEGPNLRWIDHDRRRGPGAARNTAAAAASAPWIVALDADDALYKDGLEKLYQARCEYGVVYGDIEWIGERKGIHHTEDWSIQRLFKLNGLLPVTALHTRQAWQAVGGWDEELSALEDIEYWMRLAARGVCGKRINAVTLQYRKHSDSRQSLTEQKKEVYQAVNSRIRHMHADLYSRLADMAKSCSKCPGSAGPGNGVNFMTEGVEQGISLKYVGMMRGRFQLRGHTTGLIYRVNGRGDYVIVDARDVDQFLNMRQGGGVTFLRSGPDEPQSSAPVAPPTLQEMPPSEKPEITSLKVKDALPLIEETADVLDLRVWLAEERASDEPRSTVIKAIEARLEELQTINE